MTMPIPRRLLLGAALALPAAARAQGGWSPDRPVRLVVPFAPGGSQDVLGRLFAAAVSPAIGQNIVVENRAGAGGILGAGEVARAAPDGHTLLLATAGQLTIAKAIGRRLAYDPIADFAPVIHLSDSPVALVVAPDLPVRDIAALLDHLRRAPQPVPYASTGIGTNTHLVMEDLKARERLNLEHVPYRGAAAAFNDLAAGRIALMFVSVPSVLAVTGGQFRVLGVTSRERFPGHARRADADRGRRARLRGLDLDRRLRPRRHARPGHRALAGRLRRGARQRDGAAAARGARRRRERRGRRGVRRHAARGPGALAARRGAAEHPGGVMQLTILGAGAVGPAAAALAVSRGHAVTLWSPRGGGTHGIGAALTAEGALSGTARLDVAVDLGRAVASAEAVLVSVPPHALGPVLRRVAPMLREGIPVILAPGHSLAALLLDRLLAMRGARAPVGSMSLPPVVAARTAPDRVKILSIRERVEIATVPAAESGAVARLCADLFGMPFVALGDALGAALATSEPVLQAAVAMGNLTRIEGAEQWDLHAGMTPAVCRVMAGLDAERLALARAYGHPVDPLPTQLHRATGVPEGPLPAMARAWPRRSARRRGRAAWTRRISRRA
jgi:tripartite-type tricarboxylate transporter receptor subunit TctC